VLVAGAVSASAHPSASTSLRGLKILLTNDDSMQASRPNNSDGLGLYEVRKALCAAGADVVAIASWSVQSGRGTAVTNSGTMQLGTKPLSAGYENDCSGAPSKGLVFGLCVDTAPCGTNSPGATPSDTVKFATRGGLHDVAGWDEPDLVVSGSNSGLNVANSVTDSGTVGAAVAAIEDDIPAVAFSSSATADFSTFPVGNYRATAQWGAKFLVGLRSEGLLRQHKFALNVNYPNISEGTPARRAVWASVGAETFAYHSYVRQADGSYRIALVACSGLPDCVETRKDADVPAVMQRHHITVVPINWDRTYGYPIEGKRELAKVKAYVERRAPRP
jgi:5'-nucleotidase